MEEVMATLQRITRSGQGDCKILRQKNYQSAGGDSKFMKPDEKYLTSIPIAFILVFLTYECASSFPTYAWHFGWIGGALAVYIIKITKKV